MRAKTVIYASQGARDPGLTDEDYATGMVAGTVAMAEDVNTYGFRSDDQLKVVSDEICNAITGQGIALNNNDNTQLSTMLKTKMGMGCLLTGLLYESYTTPPTLSNNVLTIPAMEVWFNTKVYYGTKQADFVKVSVSAQTISATNAWATGPWFLYVDRNGAIQHQDSPVLGSEGDQKCYIGSIFVYNGAFQDGSWSFEPWLQQTDVATRSSPTAQSKGGLIRAASATELQMGALQIKQEGINFGYSVYNPDIKEVAATSPFSYKFLYPGYNPGSQASTTLDTTHLYNLTDGTWDDVSALAGKFIVMVPCVMPTGQTLLIPAMSYKSGATYSQVFDTALDAEQAIFSLPYSLGNVARRAIYLGQSLIVKIGTTNLLDIDNLEVYGLVPQALSGFTNQGGQSGGGTGGFVPMDEKSLSGSTVNLINQACNLVASNSSYTVNVVFPALLTGKLNQLEIKFVPNASQLPGIAFPAGTKWYNDAAPDIVGGVAYTFLFEYNRQINQWVGGYLETTV